MKKIFQKMKFVVCAMLVLTMLVSVVLPSQAYAASDVADEDWDGLELESGLIEIGTYMSSTSSTTVSSSKRTIKNLLKTGLKPMGSTLYTWGGGHRSKGIIGTSSKWKKFFNKHGSSYKIDFDTIDVKNGLDCSGYIGWCVYNVMQKKSGKSSYVVQSYQMAKQFANKGWGTYKKASKVKNFKAGDIMSGVYHGHVYMVVGQCSDGSVVLMHSASDSRGVSLTGTRSSSGKVKSQAVKLAIKYMKKYFPTWYKKFSGDKYYSRTSNKDSKGRKNNYLTDYNQFRWDVSGGGVLTDPDGYRNMSAEEVLKDLFGES